MGNITGANERNVKQLHATLVLIRKLLDDQKGGRVAKARICVCANCERGYVGTFVNNRAAVLGSVDLKTMLVLGTERGGVLDRWTSALHPRMLSCAERKTEQFSSLLQQSLLDWAGYKKASCGC